MGYFGYFLIYGVVLTAVVGFIASWVDRKVTARVQYRVGPPFFQPVYDFVKLLGKEIVIPEGASRMLFLLAPVIGLSAVALASCVLWVNLVDSGASFVGDLIVVVYLLTIPSLSLIMGAVAARNVLASLGAAREMKLILSYELPFIIAVMVPIVKSGYSIRFVDILHAQASHGAFIMSASGILAFIAALMSVQAKLGLTPFDVSEAETEIIGGVLIEYSGPALAIYRLMKNMLLCTLPLFLVMIFMGGAAMTWQGILSGAGKFVLIVALITVIRNTNPRVRIDHAVKFFWGPVTFIAALGLVLALKGW